MGRPTPLYLHCLNIQWSDCLKTGCYVSRLLFLIRLLPVRLGFTATDSYMILATKPPHKPSKRTQMNPIHMAYPVYGIVTIAGA